MRSVSTANIRESRSWGRQLCGGVLLDAQAEGGGGWGTLGNESVWAGHLEVDLRLHIG